jgi:hypothetical protein
MTHEKPHHPHSHTHKHEAEKVGESYWKRAHYDWKFWVAIVLMLTSMFIYIVSLDESVQPDTQTPQQIKQPLP